MCNNRRILLLLFLFSVCSLYAAEPEMPEIRKDHPRIFFNSDTWPQVKARAEGQAREYLEALLSTVNGLTDNPVAENTGPLNIKEGRQADGSYVSLAHTSIKPIKEFGREASQCALAWRFTGEKRYLEKAKKMLYVSVNAYTEATDNRRPVSWYSTERILALCAYDWIYEALTPEERSAFIVPMVEHVRLVQPEAGLNIPRQPISSKKAGYYNMNSLLWYSGLAAYGDGFCDSLAHAQLLQGYKECLELLEYRNETAGDDGALSSPAINYAMGIYPYAQFNFMHTLFSATGKDISGDYMKLGLLPNWVWWMWIRDEEQPSYLRHHGLADTMHNINFEFLWYFYEHMTNFMHFYGADNPDMRLVASVMRSMVKTGRFGKEWPMYPYIMELDYPVSEEEVLLVENCPLKARHFESVGHFLMRSAWTPDATYCSFTAGAKVLRQHKHHDENSFTIYKRDHLALDTGDRGSQNDLNLRYYYGQSVAHNVVLIQKPGEPLPKMWGPESDDPADDYNYGGMYDAPARVLAFETNKDYTYIASDATECYGEKCTEAVRQFVYIYPDFFIVYDRVASQDPSYEKQWLLHMQNKPVINGGMMQTKSLDGKLFCQTLLPANAAIDLVGGPGKEFWVRNKNYAINPKTMANYVKNATKRGRGPYLGAWRIEVKPPAPSVEDRFLHVITAAGPERTKPVKAEYIKTDIQDGVTLNIKGRKMTFMFNRTGEVGGCVTSGNETNNLTDSVQPQEGYLLHIEEND